MKNRQLIVKRQSFIGYNTEPLEQHYQLMEQLGAGTYGRVLKAQHLATGQLRAIKVLQKAHIRDYISFQTELDILQALDHPNIIRVFETFENDLECYLVTEYCAGGELFQRIISEGHFDEAQAAFYLRQILSGVAYFHSRGICHKDLKPENILLLSAEPGSDLKIIDFGLGQRVEENELMHASFGSPYYVAPEVIEGTYDKKADCWSVGVILYIMLSGQPPFSGHNNEEILHRVKTAYFNFKPPAFRYVSEPAKDLIAQLLRKDVELRLSAQAALEHPWLQPKTPTSPHPLPADVLVGIRTFVEGNIMKKMAFFYMATMIGEADCQELRQVFHDLDTNGDGLISPQELERGLSTVGKRLDSSQLQALCLLIDANESGAVEYTEFLAACLAAREVKESLLRAAFRYFDVDGSGKVSREEVREVLCSHVKMTSVSTQQVEGILSEADTNGDGCIDYEEFLRMMQRRR